MIAGQMMRYTTTAIATLQKASFLIQSPGSSTKRGALRIKMNNWGVAKW